jgi:hypothetical protein
MWHTPAQLRAMPYPEYLQTAWWIWLSNEKKRRVGMRTRKCILRTLGVNDGELMPRAVTAGISGIIAGLWTKWLADAIGATPNGSRSSGARLIRHS